MTQLITISRDTHIKSKILPLKSFEFAKNLTLCPIFIEECSNIMSQSPIVFTKYDTGDFLVCSLLGLLPNANAFVTSEGTWKTPYYIPAIFRSYPFSIRKTKDDKDVLCVDNTQKLLSDGSSANGESLFNEDGSNSDYLNKVVALLKAIERETSKVKAALNLIVSLDLLEEWDVTVKGKDKEQKLKGLWKVSKQKLYELDEKSFCSLREHSTMDLIFSHLFSLNNLTVVGNLSNQDNQTSIGVAPSLKDRAISKQKTETALELDSLVKNLLLDD